MHIQLWERAFMMNKIFFYSSYLCLILFKDLFMKSSLYTLCSVLLLAFGVTNTAHAERWRMDTDGTIGKHEYRNPHIRYYNDWRDYDPYYRRPYQPIRYDDRYHDDHDYYGRYWDRPCDHEVKSDRYERRPGWLGSWWRD